MALPLQKTRALCEKLAHNVESVTKNLMIMPIVHCQDEREDAISSARRNIEDTTIDSEIIKVFKNSKRFEKSQFLGLAYANTKKWFGFKKSSKYVSIFTINADDLGDEKTLVETFFSFVSHTLDLITLIEDDSPNNKIRRNNSGSLFLPKNDINRTKANLRADVFSALMVSMLRKDIEEAKSLALRRANEAMESIKHHKPEDYPFFMAMEATEYISAKLYENRPAPSKRIEFARQLTIDLTMTFDDELVHQWRHFTIPAQDMAWRNREKKDIICAALNTSDDAYVRSIAYSISELTDIPPAKLKDIQGIHNAFTDNEVNERAHNKAADDIFEEILGRCLEKESSRALRDIANDQNLALLKGQVRGWCAAALQCAARAFDNAKSSGVYPAQAARLEFETGRENVDWETIKKMGNIILQQNRNGDVVTLSGLVSQYQGHPELITIIDSLNETVHSSEYKEKLENGSGYTPKTPSLQVAPSFGQNAKPKVAEQSPAPVPAPSMGLGSSSTHPPQKQFVEEETAAH